MATVLGFFMIFPLIAFMIIVAPLWVVLHYRSKRRVMNGLSAEDYEQITLLSQQANALKQRIHTLEKILDAESPTWRQHYE